ncbi:MAG TPA: branched-chain amino acid ABC transporter permease [Candidatus Dormibacteraeota bacterium]|nr:branched-chain amino acid ABC transporter permease [Candidatus Dormibacteraeota bacterium]
MFDQQLANGIFLGAVYALFAVGYTLIFGVLDILNLAHSAIFMSSSFVALALVTHGLPFWAAFPLATAFGGLLSVVLDRVAFAPLRARGAGGGSLGPLISSIAFGIIVVSVTRGFFGPDEVGYPSGTVPHANLHLGHATFTVMDLSVLVVSLLMMILLSLLLKATPLGRAIRAVAENAKAASLLGIDVERTIGVTFLIAGALGAAAGILIGAQFNAVGILMGQRIELKGLAVIILGGMGSIPGAVLGGFLLGLLEVFSVAYLSSSYRDAIAFGVMFLILIVRPGGLLGKRAARTA